MSKKKKKKNFFLKTNLRRIPSNILISKFDFFSNIFINMEEKFKNSENVMLPVKKKKKFFFFSYSSS